MEKLKNHKPGNPFKVPEDYFGSLNDRIIDNCNKTGKGIARRGFIILKPLLVLAAVIVGAALITTAVLQVIQPTNTNNLPLIGAIEEISDILYDDIDIYMIETALNDIPEYDLLPDNIYKEEIIEYLLVGEIDISMLYEHLGSETGL
jgi:hypothetical protein